MSSLKQKIQEANRIEEKLEVSLREKQLICEKMEIWESLKDIKDQKNLWREKTSEEKCFIALKFQDKGDP